MKARPRDEPESALVARWIAGLAPPLRLRDGRSLKVIFPGIPGPGHGPDVRDALLDAGGDYLKGDVEMHLLASGWVTHGHHRDPAYARVVLHVVAHDDCGLPVSRHMTGRAIPLLVAPPEPLFSSPPPSFKPPCAFLSARGQDPAPLLGPLSLRRLRMKAARLQPLVAAAGPGQALYTALMATLGGPANARVFESIAETLPLRALLDVADGYDTHARRVLAMASALKGMALDVPLRRAGLRPAAAPSRRLAAAAALIQQLWPGSGNGWPPSLPPGTKLARQLQVEGVGRSLAVELAANAVLPVALVSGAWPEPSVNEAWFGLRSPGTYGHLRELESWLGAGGHRPFASASALQAGLLLHADYCARGRCGRCPLSDPGLPSP